MSDLVVSESLAMRIFAFLSEDDLKTLSQQLGTSEMHELAALVTRVMAVRRLCERAANDPERNIGLSDKYSVLRKDGKTEAGGKHETCDHFVIDVSHDLIARPVLQLYADLCEPAYPQLARDLRKLTLRST